MVELKYVEQSIIEKMLHEFLRDKDNLQKNKNKAEAMPLPVKLAEVEISDAALESLRELGLSDEDFSPAIPTVNKKDKEIIANIFLDEFLNVFNEKMNKKLHKLLEILNQSVIDESDISNYFNSFYRDLLILKGATILAELSFSTKLLSVLGEIVEEKLMLKNDQLLKWSFLALPILGESINCLWGIREIIFREGSEESISSTDATNEKFLAICAALETIK